MSEHILEIKETLAGQRKEFACERIVVNADEAVVLYRIQREGRVEDLVLPSGTLSFGYFWTEKFYNVYHWITPNGETLGLYFNISDSTRITAEQIYWRDLTVDVLMTPGRCRVLDEDELPADLDAELLRRIENARDEVLRNGERLWAVLDERSKRYILV